MRDSKNVMDNLFCESLADMQDLRQIEIRWVSILDKEDFTFFRLTLIRERGFPTLRTILVCLRPMTLRPHEDAMHRNAMQRDATQARG